MDTKAFLAGAASATVIGLTAYYLTKESPREPKIEVEEAINDQEEQVEHKPKKLGGMKRNTNSFIITNEEEGENMRV